MSIRLEVVHGDALDYPTDVLALKFAQDLYGVDAKVVTSASQQWHQGRNLGCPEIGKPLLISSEQAVAAPRNPVPRRGALGEI